MIFLDERRFLGRYNNNQMDYMELAKTLIILIVGFVLLIKGADYFVDGAAAVAKKFRVPSLIVGLTIVALGTSLPECSVSVIASLSNRNSLAISNIVGSNFFNLLVVCGVCALFVPLSVAKGTIFRDYPFSVMCTIILGLVCFTGKKVNRLEGIVLLCCMGFFIALMIYGAISARKKDEGDDIQEQMQGWKCFLCIIGGIVAIKFGGDFVVDSASEIARMAKVSETIIGLTIVAWGTSLPELVTSLVAAGKKEVDMAVGNVIGSNIFNITWVIGVAAFIHPLDVAAENVIDIIILLVVSMLVWAVCLIRKKIERTSGIMMILMYMAFFVYIFTRK